MNSSEDQSMSKTPSENKPLTVSKLREALENLEMNDLGNLPVIHSFNYLYGLESQKLNDTQVICLIGKTQK